MHLSPTSCPLKMVIKCEPGCRKEIESTSVCLYSPPKHSP